MTREVPASELASCQKRAFIMQRHRVSRSRIQFVYLALSCALAVASVLGAPRTLRAQGSLPPPAATTPAATTPAADECVPACRSGYVCGRGTCVSACNPPCPTGQQCTGQGECTPVASAPASSAPAAPANPAQAPDAAVPPSPPPVFSEPVNTSAPARIESESPSANSHFNLHVNALGILQFGLVPGVEFGGRHFGLSGRVRVMTTGLLSHLVLADPSDDEEFTSGVGVAAIGRYYSGAGGNMRGFYVGGGLEWLTDRIEDKTDDREAYVTTVLIPQVDTGYRWVWGRFLLDLGAGVGYAIVQSATTEDLSGGQDRYLYPNHSEDQFYLIGVVNLGFFL